MFTPFILVCQCLNEDVFSFMLMMKFVQILPFSRKLPKCKISTVVSAFFVFLRYIHLMNLHFTPKPQEEIAVEGVSSVEKRMRATLGRN